MKVIIFTICFIALILLVWFKTDAFVTYVSLFGVGDIIKSKEYKEKKKTTPFTLTYPIFLSMTFDNFGIKLISCAICMAFWLSIFFALLIGAFVMFPVICIGGLLIYGAIIKLLGI
jgi:hypothetical protein